MDNNIKEIIQRLTKVETEVIELTRRGDKFFANYSEERKEITEIKNTLSGKMAYISGFRAGIIAIIFFVLFILKEATGIGHFIRKLFDN